MLEHDTRILLRFVSWRLAINYVQSKTIEVKEGKPGRGGGRSANWIANYRGT
jgi:hypothetical protein